MLEGESEIRKLPLRDFLEQLGRNNGLTDVFRQLYEKAQKIDQTLDPTEKETLLQELIKSLS